MHWVLSEGFTICPTGHSVQLPLVSSALSVAHVLHWVLSAGSWISPSGHALQVRRVIRASSVVHAGIQQSKLQCLQAESKLLQISCPHIKLPLQSEFLSQSPSPTPQGLEEVQQLQSFLVALQRPKIKKKIISIY